MKTNQIMEREFLGDVVRQEHKTGFFCMNDLLSIGNKYRKSIGVTKARWDVYHKASKTKEFITHLINSKNMADVVKTSRGRNSETWLHPLVFFDFAMWLSPEFKIKVYEWLYDNLIVFRDESGESYKKMGRLIQGKYGAGKVGLLITETARAIKNECKVTDWNKADEEQLKKRDSIHKNITILLKAGVDIDKATNLSIEEASSE